MRLGRAIQSVLTLDLIKPEWRKKLRPTDHPLRGHCYVATEVAFHLWGKERGFIPCYLHIPEGTHWFLRKGDQIVDYTAAQFKRTPRYAEGIGCGFQTKTPSKRAKIAIRRIRQRGLYGKAN